MHSSDGKQAQGDRSSPRAALSPLNSNSPFLVSFGPQGFALVYVRENLNPRGDHGNLGASCALSTRAGTPAYADCFRNNGQEPIRIDPGRIDRLAKKYRNTDVVEYKSLLLDEVVAHEAGHKLGLWHHTRMATRIELDKRQLRNLPDYLPFGRFIQTNNNNELTIAEFIYRLYQEDGFKHNKLMIDEAPSCTSAGASGPILAVSGQEPFPGKLRFPYWPIEGIEVIPAAALSAITLNSQDGEIMSHVPKLDQTRDGDWLFGSDLTGMCLRPDGCGRALPAVDCGQ